MPYSFLKKTEEFKSLGFEKYRNILLVTDSNVHKHCYSIVSNHFPNHHCLVLEPGDTYKNIESATKIWAKSLEINLGRKDLIIGLGGGVITDLVGFASATYKRGVHCAYIPTSLMAMLDAAHGGKTGVNLAGIKNSVGTFSEPEEIFIHFPFLNTLPHNELLSGFAEAIKHAIIQGGELWEFVCGLSKLNVTHFSPTFVEQLIKVKLNIVVKDFKESGERKKLNLGHSMGHALESLFMDVGKPLSHGHSVALGILLESNIAREYFGLNKDMHTAIASLIEKHFEPIQIPFSASQVLEKLSNDKKNSEKMLFTLPLDIGEVKYDCEVGAEQVEQSLRLYEKQYS